MEEKTTDGPGWAHWVTYGALTVAFVALTWTIYSVGPAVLLMRLKMLGPWLLLVVAIEIAVTSCDAAAIHAFLRPEHRKVGYLRVVMAQIAGRAVNVVTPLGSLGEVVKMTMLVERVPQARAVSAVLLYNLVGLEMSFLLVAVGAPLTAFLVDLPAAMRVGLAIFGALAASGAALLPIVVMRGMLVKLVDFARKLRLLRRSQHARWSRKMAEVDAKLRDAGGARHRDRMIGFAFLLGSRSLNWCATGVLIHAAGGPVSLGFLAAVITAGQVITWIAGIVPLGLGLSEGGNYALFSALGVNPAIGVTMALGRRVTHIIYAAIGLVLVSVNQTVKDIRSAHRASARRTLPPTAPPTPAAAPGAPSSP